MLTSPSQIEIALDKPKLEAEDFERANEFLIKTDSKGAGDRVKTVALQLFAARFSPDRR